jgi:twitching motility protein PilT
MNDTVKKQTEGAPEMLKRLIDIAMQEGASDLHFSAGYPPTIRVTGTLVPLLKEEHLTAENTRGILEAMLATEQKEEFKRAQEIDFSYEIASGARFRCNGTIQRGSVSIAMRSIPSYIRTVAELNLPPIVETFAQREQGFFLVVGPVGHGKSTTLAAMIDYVNSTRSERIVTIEDPIEYMFEQKQCVIDQREVKVDTNSFHSALLSTFRQDVNIIMVGEMRGTDTISAAVTAAETGHLVLSTLHTNNAAQTIDRIIDSFPSHQQDQIRLQLSSSLVGVFSQRLVPRIAGGLIPAFELLIANKAVANLIREKRTHELNTIIETGTNEGMVSINRTLADLVRRGEITIENAFRYSLEPQVLEKLL